MAADPEKLRRANLMNRRTVAWFLEVVVVMVTVMPPAVALLLRVRPEVAMRLLGGGAPGALVALEMAIWGVFILFRDVPGGASPGKRLVGLAVAPAADDGSGGAVPVGRRILRNVPIAIPLVPAIEFLVAYYGNERMQRLGDRMSATCVVDRSPERLGRGSWSLQLLLALALLVLVHKFVVPRLIGFYVELLF